MTKSAFKTTIISSAVQTVSGSSVTIGANPAPIEVLGTLAYPSIVTPDPQSNKYSVLLLITEQEDQDRLRELLQTVTEQTFRSNKLPPGAHNPLRSADERSPSGEFAFKHPAFRVPGAMVIRAKSGYQPQCVWGPNETSIDASEIHGGDRVVLQLSGYGYSNQSTGIGLSLGRIWLLEKGETKIERGSGATANVQRIDRSRLRFAADSDGVIA